MRQHSVTHLCRSVLVVLFAITLHSATAQITRNVNAPRGRAEIAPLTFDVASVRETAANPAPRQHFSNPIHSANLDAVMRLNQLVGEALGVNFRYQVVGGPDWFDQQNFTVTARADADVDRRLAALPDDVAKVEKRRMLLLLLQERFSLRYHLEERPAPAYFLSVLHEQSGLQPAADESVKGGISSGGVPTDISLTGRNANMKQFTGMMSYYLKSPVIDSTALNGNYDFKVHFNAQSDLQATDGGGPMPEQALADQLGLKLTRGKAPLQVVVIDSVKRPTPN